jgi:hypothetical protein
MQDDEFSIRGRDGHADTRKLNSPEELLEVLATHFGLHFPAATRFGSHPTALSRQPV